MSKIKKPIYGPPEIDEEKMTEQEVAKAKRDATLHKIRERRIRKAFRALKLRGLKNFLFWFFGVFSSIAIIFGSMFIGVKVIPVGTYTKWAGKDSSEFVSDKIAEKSIFDAFMGLSDYTFSDVPAIEKFVSDILAETGVDDFVVVDYAALKDVKFMNKDEGSDLIDEVAKCIKLNTEAKMFSGIKAFTEYQATDSPVQQDGGSWVVKEGVSKSHYCYAVANASGNQPLNTVVNSNTQVSYADVFVNGELADALKNKTPEQMAEIKFFYKPVSQLPLLDVVNGLTTVLGRIEITDVLSMVGNGEEIDPLLSKIFGGKSIGNLIADMDVDGLLDKLMISDLGNVEEVFGQLGGLPVFSAWEPVPTEKKPELVDNKITYKEGTEEFTSNPKLFYYLQSGTHGEEDAVYAPAFSDDGVRVETLDDSTILYYPNLTEVSFSRALAVIGDSIGTLEITELLGTFIDDLGEGDLIYDILEGTSIGELGTNFDGDSIMGKITLGTIGGMEALGDLGSIIAYKEWREVVTAPVVEEGIISADFDASVYYYLSSGTHGASDAEYLPAFNVETGERKAEVADSTKLYYQSGWEIVLVADAPDTETVSEQVVITKDGGNFTSNPRLYYYLPTGANETDNDAYVRAFDDDGVRVAEVTDATVLYYANLNTVKFDQVTEIIGDSIGRKKLTTLLETFGATIESGSVINNILGDKTVSQVGEITENSIHLTDVLSYGENKKMYDILISALLLTPEKEAGETNESPSYQQKLQEVARTITLGSLSELNTDNINLDVVLPEASNAKLFSLLRSANDMTDDQPVTIGALNGLNIDNVSLTALFEYSGNEGLYDILLSALVVKDKDNNVISNPTAEQIKIGHLSSFNKDNIELNLVLPESSNQKLYSIIRSARGLEDDAVLTLGSLNGMDINNAELSSVLDVPTTANGNKNKTLYDILLQALTVTDTNGNGSSDYDDIKISNLNSFSTNNIKLATVMGSSVNEKLKLVLSQASGKEFGEVTVAHLGSSDFDIGKVKLTSVMTKTLDSNGKLTYGNNILDAVLDPVNGGNDITINNIGTKIGELSLYDAYGKDCFTTDFNESVDKTHDLTEDTARKFIFDESLNAFVHVTDEELSTTYAGKEVYYLHKNDGIWLLICFVSEEYEDDGPNDTDGRPERYVISDKKLNDLQDASTFKSLFKNATIRQFVDAGIVAEGDYQDYIYTLNIEGVIDALNAVPVTP